MSVATLAAPTGIETRAITGLLACIARFGFAKTTIDDVAREAGCSRATLYRYFGGKPELVQRTVDAEHARIAARVVEAGRAAPSLPDAVVASVTVAARELAGHDALQFLLAHEADVVLGHLAFGPGDRVLVAVGDAWAPAFDRWLSASDAARAGDWLARVLRSYVLMPDPPVDLTDAGAARPFLDALVVPGLLPALPESR